MNANASTSHHTLDKLQPAKLWQWFETICSIPHPSYHEEALATHIMNWAAAKGFEALRDQAGNVFIKKPASPGMEDRASIALQAHLDMVTQANHDYDFLTQPIRPYIDGEWVTADGTTLGADNGIGLASILAVLDSDDLAHPTLEALLTMTEETGMDGARGLSPSLLKSRLMINADTEEIDEIYLGCAGGVDVDFNLPITRTPSHSDDVAIAFSLQGLKGGHSGIDIHKNNGNAIKLLAHILSSVIDAEPEIASGLRLHHLKGGTARNAIPRAAEAVLVLPSAQKDLLHTALDTRCHALRELIGTYENNFHWTIQDTAIDTTTDSLSLESTRAVIDLLNATPNGVLRYSDQVADTVETSLSLGKVKTDGDALIFSTLVRSLNETGKHTATTALLSLARLAGATAELKGNYIGWDPNPNSAITAVAVAAYRSLGVEPSFHVIHAGLECGLIQCAYPDMDIVSIGPTIKNAHSPDEMVHIDSVARYWQVLTTMLANAPLAAS